MAVSFSDEGAKGFVGLGRTPRASVTQWTPS